MKKDQKWMDVAIQFLSVALPQLNSYHTATLSIFSPTGSLLRKEQLLKGWIHNPNTKSLC
jgi:hypothetical protein